MEELQNTELFEAPEQVVNNSVETRLPKPMRQEMENKFATDFSNVKIMESQAATLHGGKAFTQGNEIYFEPGGFSPFTNDGKDRIAHELAHVAEQGGRVAVQAADQINEALNNSGNDNNE